jgi:hypothetical protein
MYSRVDDRLRSEAALFRLRFGCEHCAYFAEIEGRCSEGFPNREHHGISLRVVESVCFCKKFELC